jgi:hypothetical protein
MDSSSHKGPRRDCDDQGYGILDLIKSCKQGEPKVESNGENRISFMPEILGQITNNSTRARSDVFI